MDDEIKYPDVEVQLTGEDSNGFFIVGRVRTALKSAGVPTAEMNEFTEEAMSGDYNHLLQTVMKWVSVN